jgi:hypothetical protein
MYWLSAPETHRASQASTAEGHFHGRLICEKLGVHADFGRYVQYRDLTDVLLSGSSFLVRADADRSRISLSPFVLSTQ